MPHGHIPLEALYRAPVVWVLMGQKAGDNSQVLALAEGIGWPFEIKQFVHQPYELVTNLALGTTLAGVVKGKSSPLEAPWPDLVLSAGRRNEPIARWIRERAAADGHPVRLVHVGRPWSGLEFVRSDRDDAAVSAATATKRAGEPDTAPPRHPQPPRWRRRSLGEASRPSAEAVRGGRHRRLERALQL